VRIIVEQTQPDATGLQSITIRAEASAPEELTGPPPSQGDLALILMRAATGCVEQGVQASRENRTARTIAIASSFPARARPGQG
jgi:hypothetical protein